MTPVTVFILDLNRSEDTVACVRRLLQGDENNADIHILINGSDEQHKSVIKQSLQDANNVYIYESKLNRGFAGGINHLFELTIKHRRLTDTILLLNNDALLDADNLSMLRKALVSDENIGIVSPKILHSQKKQTIVEDGIRFYPWLMQHSPLNSGKKINMGEVSQAREALVVNGTCMLLRTEVFKKLSGFNESFFAYFEDWDLCFRASKLGYRILYVPTAVISHQGSATTGKQTLIYQFLLTRNRFLIARKHLPLLIFIVVFLPYFLFSKVLLKSVLLLSGQHFSAVKGLYQALLFLCLPDRYRTCLWPVENSSCPSGS